MVAASKAFLGSWLFVDWPFAKIMEIQEASGGLLDFRAYDIDCDDVAEAPSGKEGETIKGSPYAVLRAECAANGAVALRVRYPGDNPNVDYVLHKPTRKGTMRAECSWTEEFVNTCGGKENGKVPPIVGCWRYYETEYTSLVVEVSMAPGGKYRVKVTNSADSKTVPVKLLGVSETEVGFVIKEDGMVQRLVTNGPDKATCHITQKQLWTRCAYRVVASDDDCGDCEERREP